MARIRVARFDGFRGGFVVSGREDAAAVVAYVCRGSQVDPDGRPRLERVDREFLVDIADYAEFVVLEDPGDGLEALESIRERAIPTILYDRTADPAVGLESIRLGVTEYVTDGVLADGTLADQIVAAVDRESASVGVGYVAR